MPARQAIADGQISSDASLLDFGSGRGQDVERLTRMGYDARGWDPHFARDDTLRPADTVMLTYVLNVIENPVERRRTLLDAWSLCNKTLVVAVRLTWDRSKVNGSPLQDGTLTSRQTFQHLFTTDELRKLVEEVCEKRSFAVRPGVVYVFRHDRDRLAFIALSMTNEFSWDLATDAANALERAVEFTHQRGRPPTFDEIPDDVLPVLGTVSAQVLARLVKAAADPALVANGARRATLDALLYLGVARFSGRPRLGDLPLSLQVDLRAHFTSYRDASRRADRLLLKLRDDQYLRGAMRNSVGKLTPTALYVHRRAVADLPVILRLYEHCAFVAAGRPNDWNLLKLNHDGRRVAWSWYPRFDRDPHPTLESTYGVELSTLRTSFRRYESDSNRPLLHRKHEFLTLDDPHYEKYERLTRSEVRAGLYADPSRIGLENGWQIALKTLGLTLRGHRLVRSPSRE